MCPVQFGIWSWPVARRAGEATDVFTWFGKCECAGLTHIADKWSALLSEKNASVLRTSKLNPTMINPLTPRPQRVVSWQASSGFVVSRNVFLSKHVRQKHTGTLEIHPRATLCHRGFDTQGIHSHPRCPMLYLGPCVLEYLGKLNTPRTFPPSGGGWEFSKCAGGNDIIVCRAQQIGARAPFQKR